MKIRFEPLRNEEEIDYFLNKKKIHKTLRFFIENGKFKDYFDEVKMGPVVALQQKKTKIKHL